MESDLKIDVAALDTPLRRALEDVIGRQLGRNQRLVISVIELETEPIAAERPPQSIEEWTHVYDGLSDKEIAAIDATAKSRANLTRDVP
jgi:hypothetical protein